MHFFKKFFSLKDDVHLMPNGEYKVCCPFPHKDLAGNEYMETNPSAHINPEKDVLHCKVCGKGWSEATLLSEVEGIPYKEALRTLHLMNQRGGQNWSQRHTNLLSSPATLDFVGRLGLSPVINTLQLGFSGEGVDFPVFMYGELMDVRNYNPERTPKVLGTKGSKNLIVPFDLWRVDERPTLLCAGEKDMAIARVHGFNSITFTGGEGSFPKLFKHSFKGKQIYIVYDNDSAGRDGAYKAAHFIKEAGGHPFIVTGHYDVCVENGEDLHDFFMKYGKTAEDLKAILNATSEADGQVMETVKNNIIPLVKIDKAFTGGYANSRFVRSHVTVMSVFDEAFNIPEYVRFIKTADDETSEYRKGDQVEWILDENNIEDILHLMDGRVTEMTQRKALRSFVGIPAKEDYWHMTVMSYVAVHKSVVVDTLDTSESSGDENIASQITMYGVDQRMRAGKKYEAYYKPVSHPTEGQKVVGIVMDLKPSGADIKNFKVNQDVIESLKMFQVKEGSNVARTLNEHFERSKGFVGVESRAGVTMATDMFFHTPMDFKFGNRTERAYLDIMIVGDPRTMKSQTAKEMRSMYELGTVTSLKTATEGGLIGGADKVNGSWRTKIGLIPQCHNGALIMEEFSGASVKMISKLTEIRSSGHTRILRMDGQTDVMSRVRMLSISNPRTNGAISLGLSHYPSGIKVILDLIGASEDIARYDFFLLVEETDNYTSPLSGYELEPYPKKAYMDRIRWVWSRSAEQVELTPEVAEYIIKCAGILNEDYDCNIKLFGAEAWKKLARCAIAIAGLVCSTDESFENLIVKKEHVDFAAYFMKNLYDNPIFKLKNYVTSYREYNQCRPVDVAALQGLYTANAALLEEMEVSTDMTAKNMQLISGLDMQTFSALMNRLGSSKFIQWQGERIMPTSKFRKAMRKIKRDVYVKRPSEI